MGGCGGLTGTRVVVLLLYSGPGPCAWVVVEANLRSINDGRVGSCQGFTKSNRNKSPLHVFSIT
jgi:hypothetical protein